MEISEFSPDVQAWLKIPPSWTDILPADPRAALLCSDESFTVYRTLTDLLDLPQTHPDVEIAHKAVLEDPLVKQYIALLSDWETTIVTGHNQPAYLPNQLWLLLDWGILPQDHPRVAGECQKILAHQDPDTGQFLAYSKGWRSEETVWTSVLCDHNLITSVLLFAGFGTDKRVQRGLARMSELLVETSQGPGWKCVPGLGTKFRGPGRVNDVCPMAVVDALRGYWILEQSQWPASLIPAGKTLLECWTHRGEHKPYMFGHGRNYRKPRPPFIWYNIGTVLDATSHYPPLVKTDAFRELLAVATLAFDKSGLVTPGSIIQAYKTFSFGQKKKESPWETLFLARIFKRAVLADPSLLTTVKQLDGSSYGGSLGGPKKKNNGSAEAPHSAARKVARKGGAKRLRRNTNQQFGI